MRTLTVQTCLLLSIAFGGTLSGGEEKKDEDGLIIKFVSSLEEVEHGHAKYNLREAFKKLPEGYRIRLAFEKYIDPYKNTKETFFHDFVPVNPKGEFDGLQHFMSNWRQPLKRIVPWKNGKREGTEKHFRDIDGKLILDKEIPWKDNQKEGLFRSFYNNGKVRSETMYKNDEPNGLSKQYDIEGRLSREVTMKNGKREGLMKEYWPESGTVRREVPYTDGRVNGVAKEYYADGKPKRTMTFKEDVLHGEEILYDGEGSISTTRYWFDGEKVKKSEFQAKSGEPTS